MASSLITPEGYLHPYNPLSHYPPSNFVGAADKVCDEIEPGEPLSWAL